MRKFDGEVDYILHDGLDVVVDEKGQQFLALRKVQWGSKGMESDPSKAKLEIRKWIPQPEGKDKANKGVSFLTDDGPHELTKALVDLGYGKTKEIIISLKKREDFKESVENLYTEDEESSEEYFDARSILLDE